MNNAPSRIKKAFLLNLIDHVKALSTIEPEEDADNIWYRHIHSIVGTAGSIGFSTVSDRLLPWEEKLAHVKNSRYQLNNEDKMELKKILLYLSDFVRENDRYLLETEEKDIKVQEV